MADLQTLLGDSYKEGMTLEEVNAALAEKEFVDRSTMDGYVPKKLLEDANSEAADYKKKWRATLSEVEQKRQDEADEKAALQAENAKLKKESALARLTGNYLSLGYDAENAKKIAEAVYDGDTDEVFRMQTKHQEDMKKNIEADLMKKMPDSPSGNPTKVDFSKQKEAALAAGDMALYASYIRQESEANEKK